MMTEEINSRLRGCVYSIFTPFTDDDQIDYETLARYMRHLFDGGARIFYAMAYNSRYAQLSNDEILELNAFVCREARRLDPACFVIVGDPIHCTTKVSTEFARHAKENGADMISLLVQEKYYCDEQILEHFDEVGRDSDFPVLVHEMAFLSGMDGKQMHWPTSLLSKLRSVSSIAALKEDAKTPEITRAALALEPDIRVVVSGAKAKLFQYREDGVQAYLNGVSMIDARIGQIFWKAFETGDDALAQRIVDEVETPFFAGAIASLGWHRVNKALLQAAGLFPHRRDRMPLKTISDAEHGQVVEEYASINNAWNSIVTDLQG
ncbi:dihydrodipicolinate synthase family protein [Roseibium sp. HPY-6]|uniref:dihydrodipicolinate synthase family protein n=1 Tax=Roseibium sp. HPY-6 TaxID=3229852 RepID=UPI00338D56EE